MTPITISAPNAMTTGHLTSATLAPAVTSLGKPQRGVPAFIRADEAYYWSFRWQEDVRESVAALKSGDFEEFNSDNPNDVVRWLLTEDEDD
jgi:hypothetical protein